MEIIHDIGILRASKSVNENAGFLLTNKKGSYCSFSNAPSSRYGGLFYFDDKAMEMYKFIEGIEIIGNAQNKVSGIRNGLYFAEMAKGSIIESFLMPKDFNSLVYELSSESEIDLFLDCKKSYDNREFGRYYSVYEEKGCIVVKFAKRSDRKEDSSDGVEEFVLYLAIKSDTKYYKKNDAWAERRYPYDEERNSPPFKRYVYNALRLRGSKFVFSMSKSRNSAVNECSHIFSNLRELKNKERECFLDLLENEQVKNILMDRKISKEIRIAYVNAINSLNNLTTDNKNNGVFAGLPWFFQFWSRDSLISLKALSQVNNELSKKILFGCLNGINGDGRLPNLIGRHAQISPCNADSHGWLFFRCFDAINKISQNRLLICSIKNSIKLVRQHKNSNSERIKGHLKKCSLSISKKEEGLHKMSYEIESSLEKALNGLLKFHTKGNFEVNGMLETWMDTEFNNDAREGIRIEVQALRLNMYKLMFALTQNKKYKILENLLKISIREELFNGKVLADGLGDFTIRPNIFIAAYIYPELLSINEWEACFDNALKALWLEWGGLSTIDKSHHLYTEESTGENVKSYHRGDSWFWLNNLSALVLKRVNKDKFSKHIRKIIDASTEEILWKGSIGCHAELSSAKELSSKGCFSQAWSNAMYIEVVNDVFE